MSDASAERVERVVKIYTKHGDGGETGLLYGGRVSKTHPRTEAYGAVDEAVSALGVVRALSQDERVRTIVAQLQRELFTVGAELATDPDFYDKLEQHFSTVSAEMTAALERLIDELTDVVVIPPVFVLPGTSAASAAIDVARSTLRRAERRAVALAESGALKSPEVLRYLNRASDLLFVLARYEDRDLPVERVGGERRP